MQQKIRFITGTIKNLLSQMFIEESHIANNIKMCYTYLSQLLMKTTNGIVTRYVYGLGLIGEEKLGSFRTYHFDYRGSTVAITDESGNITDTFEYDTYGRLLSRTGTSFVIFGYNGRDGVVTDRNGLIYMRARYYSPELRRFVNADILHGNISDSTSLNRYAYVNGNPVSFVDPFGLNRDESQNIKAYKQYGDLIIKALEKTSISLEKYYRNRQDNKNFEDSFNDAYMKIFNAINSGSNPEAFLKGMKIKIEINPNGYNTSGDEITREIANYIPVLEQIVAFVDYDSNEEKDSSKLVEALISIITEKNVAEKLQPITTMLERLGGFSDVLNTVDLIETIANWNSSTKQATEVSVFVQIEQGNSYWYHASVDNNLRFKKLYSAYTGTVIQENESRFIIDVQ